MLKRLYLPLLALSLVSNVVNSALVNQTLNNCCNPCVPECQVSGIFQIGCPGAIFGSDCGPCLSATIVANQCGRQFLVSQNPVNPFQFIVTFNQPFCTRVAVTANSSSGSVFLVNPTARNSFTIEAEGGFIPGEIVSFRAVPVSR